MSEHTLRNKKEIERIYLVGDFGISSLFCKSSDVEELEASHAELLEALHTLTAVVGLTPLAANKDALQEAFNIARAAIAKAEGEVML
jgi:hypothetical protein